MSDNGKEAFGLVCKLLGVPETRLEESICNRTIVTKRGASVERYSTSPHDLVGLRGEIKVKTNDFREPKARGLWEPYKAYNTS